MHAMMIKQPKLSKLASFLQPVRDGIVVAPMEVSMRTTTYRTTTYIVLTMMALFAASPAAWAEEPDNVYRAWETTDSTMTVLAIS